MLLPAGVALCAGHTSPAFARMRTPVPPQPAGILAFHACPSSPQTLRPQARPPLAPPAPKYVPCPGHKTSLLLLIVMRRT